VRLKSATSDERLTPDSDFATRVSCSRMSYFLLLLLLLFLTAIGSSPGGSSLTPVHHD
jgi:hypothetical protein